MEKQRLYIVEVKTHRAWRPWKFTSTQVLAYPIKADADRVAREKNSYATSAEYRVMPYIPSPPNKRSKK